jgi:hypothetical protein
MPSISGKLRVHPVQRTEFVSSARLLRHTGHASQRRSSALNLREIGETFLGIALKSMFTEVLLRRNMPRCGYEAGLYHGMDE